MERASSSAISPDMASPFLPIRLAMPSIVSINPGFLWNKTSRSALVPEERREFNSSSPGGCEPVRSLTVPLLHRRISHSGRRHVPHEVELAFGVVEEVQPLEE